MIAPHWPPMIAASSGVLPPEPLMHIPGLCGEPQTVGDERFTMLEYSGGAEPPDIIFIRLRPGEDPMSAPSVRHALAEHRMMRAAALYINETGEFPRLSIMAPQETPGAQLEGAYFVGRQEWGERFLRHGQ